MLRAAACYSVLWRTQTYGARGEAGAVLFVNNARAIDVASDQVVKSPIANSQLATWIATIVSGRKAIAAMG